MTDDERIKELEEEIADRASSEQALMRMLDAEITDNARLREALERIANTPYVIPAYIAREALEGK